MNYHVIHDNPDEDLLTRLFTIRGINDNIDSFLDPKINDYRIDPFLLNDMQKAVNRIIQATKNNEKIMIFGDYDVDGITSSYILYDFVIKFLKYKKISIQYPDRIKEGYGLKKIHIDDIKKKGVTLIITVDNGIASLEEAKYAKEQGIDLIITDHHQDLESIPEAVAVVNPQVSPNYPFKGLAGVGVSFKLICALLTQSTFNKKQKNNIFNYFLPIVAIGTIADVVPLIDENRAIVKRGLELLNTKSELSEPLKGFLKYLKIKGNIESYHIGFIIGPRINAGGRIASPYDSLYTLLYSGEEQIKRLDKLEEINTERKKIQDNMFKEAETKINLDKKMLIVYSENFHEGVVGIVSGRLTEKYNKPSMIMKINKKRQIAVASLRGPEYFNIIEMLKKFGDRLERFGGHKCAGGLTVKLENLDEIIEKFQTHCEECITDEKLIKSVKVDTKIYEHERNNDTLTSIDKLAPFGEGNKEPVFLIENMNIQKIEEIGNKTKTHLKVHGKLGDKTITTMFRGKGADAKQLIENNITTANIVGKIRKDTYNGGFFLDGLDIE